MINKNVRNISVVLFLFGELVKLVKLAPKTVRVVSPSELQSGLMGQDELVSMLTLLANF